jgi:dihydroorotate dehydrogenase
MQSQGVAAALARAALPALQRLDPELAHRLALSGLRLVKPAWRTPHIASELAIDLLGLRFAHPVGLAAGFDKNAEYLDALGALGFSHIEIGTVTPRAQSGNPRPRLFRLRRAGGLVNRMGFNNRGADYVAANLRASRYRGVRGVSIGKNADTPLERAADDYVECLRALYAHADYFALNVSSPNTPRLRELQAGDALEAIVGPLQDERARLAPATGRRPPLLLKVAPDLTSAELISLCAQIRELGLDGVIAGNTTVHLEGVEGVSPIHQGGGLSGRPLHARALALVRTLRAGLGAMFPIIGVGGIMDAPSARAMLDAGANLLQVYTGFIYNGHTILTGILESLADPRGEVAHGS